jgi:hypothetical protein
MQVVLLLPGHRKLGEFWLEQVGTRRVVNIPGQPGSTPTTLLITTSTEGPTCVLQVVDLAVHPAAAAAAGGAAVGSTVSSNMLTPLQEVARLTGAGQGWSKHNPLARNSSSRLGRREQGAASSAGAGAVTPFAAAGLQLPAAAAGSGAGSSASSTAATAGPSSSSSTADGTAAGAVRSTRAPSASSRRRAAAVWQFLLQPQSRGDSEIDLSVSLQGLGVSLVSDTQELLYGSVTGLRLRVWQGSVRRSVAAVVSALKLQNTLYQAQYPVLAASPVSRSVFGVVYVGADASAGAASGTTGSSSSSSCGSSTPGSSSAVSSTVNSSTAAAGPVAIAGMVTLWRAKPGGVVCVEDCQLHLAPLAVSIEGQHLKRLLEFRSNMESKLAATAGDGPGAQGGSGPLAGVAGGSSSMSGLALRQQQQPGLGSSTQLQLASPTCSTVDLPPLAAAAAGGGGGGTSGYYWTQHQQQLLLADMPPQVLRAALQPQQVKLYFDQLYISPLQLCITFSPGSWFSSSLPAESAGGATSAAASAAAGAATKGSSEASATTVPRVAEAAAAAVVSGGSPSRPLPPAAAAGSSSSGAGNSSGSRGATSSPEQQHHHHHHHQQQQQSQGASGSRQSSSSPAPTSAGTGTSTPTPTPPATGTTTAASYSGTSGTSGTAGGGTTAPVLPVWGQMALALASAEGAWLTLGAFSLQHPLISSEALVQVSGGEGGKGCAGEGGRGGMCQGRRLGEGRVLRDGEERWCR